MSKEEYIEFDENDYLIFTEKFVYVKTFPFDIYKITHFDDVGVYINDTRIKYKDSLSQISFKDDEVFGKIKPQ